MKEYKLLAGKNQKIFDNRLKNNEMRIINHGRDDENCYCRICEFSSGGKNILAYAKKHAQKTGHTVDVYYETHREITYYKNPTNK